MTTSTIELMKAAIARGDEGSSATYLNIVTATTATVVGPTDKTGTGRPRAATAELPKTTEITKTTWSHGLELADDLVILPDHEADAGVPLWMDRLYGDPPARPRLRPMHPDSVPSGLTRSWRYLTFLRQRGTDPETYHRFLAADTISHLRTLLPLRDALTVDIGGQAGFVSDALRDEGARCHAIEHCCPTLEPHDGQSDRAARAHPTELPLACGVLDLAYCSDVLQNMARPEALLAEMVRILKPGTGIGYLAFTNRRSALGRYGVAPSRSGVGVRDVLNWFAARTDVEVRCCEPRYWPAFAKRVVDVEGLREIATGSLRVVFRRTSFDQPT